MKKLSVVIICLALGFATACSKESPPAEEAGPHKVIAVGSQWYGHIPVWIGIENGIFERHGFKVEWRPIGKSMDRLNAISSGEAQFASLGEIAMLTGRDLKWDPVKETFIGDEAANRYLSRPMRAPWHY